MDLSITFRHVPPSDALRAACQQKLDRLERHVHAVAPAHVVLEVERHAHSAEFVIPVDGHVLVARAVRDDLYEAIDAAGDKALEQARRLKDRHRDHHPREGANRKAEAQVAV